MKNAKWNMKFLMLLAIISMVSASCSVGPEPIHYGEDNCVLCAMTIMDTRYGTEIVTKKGKVFKFDSVECLVEFLQKDGVDSTDVKLILVTPFNRPEDLVDATASHFLNCKDLASPMGMFLTAFETEATAMNFKDQFGGKVYCWEGLNRNFQLLRLKGAVE